MTSLIRIFALPLQSMNRFYSELTSYILCLSVAFLFPGFSTGQDLLVEHLNEGVNSSSYHEISPVLSRDGRTLYFTRVADPRNSKIIYENGKEYSFEDNPTAYNSKIRQVYNQLEGKEVALPEYSDFNQDIWIADSDFAAFDQIIHPGYPLNSALPNSLSSITPDGNTFIVINQFNPEGGMNGGFSTIKKDDDGVWGFPLPFSISHFYTNSPDVSLTLNINGDALITSMSRDDALGQNDLFVSFRIADNLWGNPINLGTVINTSSHEISPYLLDDNVTLYFASNRAGSMGGMDIYKTTRLDGSWLNWSIPEKLPYPINTSSDDTHPCFNATSGYLYFCSKRKGTSDIFRCQMESPRPMVAHLEGSVYDIISSESLDARITLRSMNDSSVEYKVTSTGGMYSVKVPYASRYKMIAEKDSFGTIEKIIDIQPELVSASQVINADIGMLPIAEETKLVLDKIYFKKSTAIVLSESLPQMNELARMMKDRKDVHIVIEGHTDNQGDREQLNKLSENRAKTIKMYLINEAKIDDERIRTIGYGPDHPLNENYDEEERAQNRRVEVRILTLPDSVVN